MDGLFSMPIAQQCLAVRRNNGEGVALNARTLASSTVATITWGPTSQYWDAPLEDRRSEDQDCCSSARQPDRFGVDSRLQRSEVLIARGVRNSHLMTERVTSSDLGGPF